MNSTAAAAEHSTVGPCSQVSRRVERCFAVSAALRNYSIGLAVPQIEDTGAVEWRNQYSKHGPKS